MSNEFFPKNKHEALAFLYLKNQDLSGKTPEQIFDIFENVLKSLIAYSKTKNYRD